MYFENLTEGETFIFEWQYNTLGDFGMSLAKTIMLADTKKQAQLAMGFPEEVQAYLDYTGTKGWWADVKKRAGHEHR